ncbi:MAG TPA: hypothetical protein VJP88_11725 [Caulobacteraceae bacterium]|nr:hypothetical protein [Caulobacteraceae bacterium]
MSLSEILQLYAPLAGMLAMAFWVGVLSERIKGLRADLTDLESSTNAGGLPSIIRLEEQVRNMDSELQKLNRGVEGVQRQIGNLMQTRAQIVELKHE